MTPHALTASLMTFAKSRPASMESRSMKDGRVGEALAQVDLQQTRVREGVRVTVADEDPALGEPVVVRPWSTIRTLGHDRPSGNVPTSSVGGARNRGDCFPSPFPMGFP